MSKQPNWDLIAGIVLDAVGTLIKPVPSVAEAYVEAARRQGVELEREELRARFNLHFQSDEVRGDRGIHSTDEATEIWRWRRIVSKVLPEVPDPAKGFRRIVGPFPPSRVMAVLCRRRPGPAGDSRGWDRRLRGLELRRPPARGGHGPPELSWAVDALVISSEVGFRKPHPAFFQAVCERLGLAPRQVLCVGDDIENDVRGALRAGLSAMLLDRGFERPHDFPHVPDLTALLESRLAEA